jgi:hypothetical protein
MAKIYAKLGNQHVMRSIPIVVALSSPMTLTKLKIYAKSRNKHAMTPLDCKLGSKHARRESEEHSTNNSSSFY